MVAQPGSYQASFNAGELNDALHGRTDIKQFYAGAAYMRNCEPVPQGGGRLSPRSRHLGRIRNALEAVAGTTPTPSLGPHEAAATIYSLALDATVALAVVRLEGLSADPAIGALLQLEYWDGSAWLAFGGLVSAGADPVTTTLAQPPGAPVDAAALRLRLTEAPAEATTFTLTAMTALIEGAAASAVRIKPFTFALDQTYMAVLTDGHADFYRDGAFVGAAIGVAEENLSRLDAPQRFDTMLLFHEDVVTARILRNGSDHEWIVDVVPFENIPSVDLGGSYDNAVGDSWAITVRFPSDGPFAGGDNIKLSLNVNGEETAAVDAGDPADWNALAELLEDALADLPSLKPGIDVAATGGSTFATIDINFGGENLGDSHVVAAQVVNSSEASAVATHSIIGKPGGEPLMSASAGWPAAATFYQDRLVTGGFRGKRSAVLASVTGEYFDCNTEIAATSGALLHNVDTDGAERIQRITRARHLVIFTSDAEYFVSDRALARGTPPNVVECSRNGSAATLPIVESEGALFYFAPDKADADRKGVRLYAMSYDDVSQAYVSTPQSLLASHLVAGAIDAALQKGGRDTDASRLWIVRDDGTMSCGVMILNQDVMALTRWQTAGAVKAVGVDGKGRPHIAVERAVGETTELHFERLDQGLLFDDVVDVTLDPADTAVPGLDRHEGQTVWAKADGFVVGPFTVTNGEITLPAAASAVSVGRWTPLLARTLPLPQEVAERVRLERPIRVHTVRIGVKDTTSLAIGANGRAASNVALVRAGEATDTPPAPATRKLVVTGLVGVSDDGQVEVTQTRPGLLQWTGLTIEAAR